MPTKISIFASIGCQNLGDELILKNEIKLLQNRYGNDTQFTIFSYDPQNPFFTQENVFYKEYFPIGIRNKKNLWRNIKNFFVFFNEVSKSDFIVIGGGGIFYDTEKQIAKNPLAQWLGRVSIIKFLRKKIIFFRVGIDIKNPENLKIIKKIFSKAFEISVRDINSFDILKGLGIKANLEKDPVFFEKNEEGTQKISYCITQVTAERFCVKDIEKIDFQGKTVALAFRQGYLSKDKKYGKKLEEGKINELINYLLSQKASIILLPHSFHKTDILANDALFLEKFLRNNENISLCENLQESYSIYTQKKADTIIAERLHSIILAQVYEIPFIAVSYATKTDEILKSIGE